MRHSSKCFTCIEYLQQDFEVDKIILQAREPRLRDAK